jgi:hypothetical protein
VATGLSLQSQQWILIVQIELSKHVPFHLTIAGYPALVSYVGQPTRCYACNALGHLIQNCSGRQRTQAPEVTNRKETWATLIAREEGQMTDKRDTRIPPKTVSTMS